MTELTGSEARFRLGVAALALLYLSIQLAYISRLPLVMDEFQSGWTIFDLTRRLPYRDFFPYKTVLGHYLQLPPMLLPVGLWKSLILVKVEMALINAMALAAAAVLLSRFFLQRAVFLGLGLTVLMTTFLERSSEIRVDMLTAWAGFFSLIALLKQRWGVAGALAGISFLLSQKGIYYCVAGGLATLAWFFPIPGKSGARFRATPPMGFGIAALVPIGAYLLFWTFASSWEAVYHATFVRPQGVALQILYDNIRGTYWLQTTSRNPLFYALSVAGLIQLALHTRHSTDRQRDRGLLAYGTVLMSLAIWHKQPWPYFFVLIVPTSTVLIISFFDRFLRQSGEFAIRLRRPMVVVYLGAGVVVPMVRLPVNLLRDNAPQRETVRIASCILNDDDQYLAGLEMLYKHTQPLSRLRWIDRPQAEALRRLDAPAQRALADSLHQRKVRLVVDNYRLQGLPPVLRSSIEADFTHLWGNVFVYGPELPPGSSIIRLRFGGTYVATGRSSDTIVIDDRTASTGDTLTLSEGTHTVVAPSGTRLRLSASGCEADLDPRYRDPVDLFPQIYTY